MRSPGWWWVVLVACTHGSVVQAQSCSTVLTADITLSGDMNCVGHPYAFKVAAPGVVIRLNGNRIRGDMVSDGIVVADVGGVNVIGPGRIEMFFNAVSAVRADDLSVAGVEFVNHANAGVALVNSRNASLLSNRFRGFMELAAIDVRQPPGVSGSGAGGHHIAYNTFDQVFYGINICGADAGGSIIHDNSFARIVEIALAISHEADDNWIAYNKFKRDSPIWLRSSSRNTFEGNVLEDGAGGLYVAGATPWECVTRTGAEKAIGNQILHNKTYGTLRPFQLGRGASENRLYGNAIQGATVGIGFDYGSFYNDGRGNVYPGTATPVIDLGIGNLY